MDPVEIGPGELPQRRDSPRPVLRMVRKPLVYRDAGGSWVASYAGESWSVWASSRTAAIEQLKARAAELIRQDTHRTRRMLELLEQAEAGPVDGVTIEPLTEEP